jgi:hypothetical protein
MRPVRSHSSPTSTGWAADFSSRWGVWCAVLLDSEAEDALLQKGLLDHGERSLAEGAGAKCS